MELGSLGVWDDGTGRSILGVFDIDLLPRDVLRTYRVVECSSYVVSSSRLFVARDNTYLLQCNVGW